MKVLLRLKAWQLFLLNAPWYMFTFISPVFDVLYLNGTAIFFGWIFSIGYVMHSFIQSPSKPKIIYFEITFSFFVIWCIIDYFIPMNKAIEYWIWPLAALGGISLLYSFGFAARMFESVRQGEIVNRSDSLRTLFYILFFPIGIWFLQPSINEIMAEKESIAVEETQSA